jgi:hypothetical protein
MRRPHLSTHYLPAEFSLISCRLTPGSRRARPRRDRNAEARPGRQSARPSCVGLPFAPSISRKPRWPLPRSESQDVFRPSGRAIIVARRSSLRRRSHGRAARMPDARVSLVQSLSPSVGTQPSLLSNAMPEIGDWSLDHFRRCATGRLRFIAVSTPDHVHPNARASEPLST